jgi:hypothetical protein
MCVEEKTHKQALHAKMKCRRYFCHRPTKTHEQ